jgi:hypothetical protein
MAQAEGEKPVTPLRASCIVDIFDDYDEQM